MVNLNQVPEVLIASFTGSASALSTQQTTYIMRLDSKHAFVFMLSSFHTSFSPLNARAYVFLCRALAPLGISTRFWVRIRLHARCDHTTHCL